MKLSAFENNNADNHGTDFNRDQMKKRGKLNTVELEGLPINFQCCCSK